MKYQVIARKFRPQVFSEVVGQKPIIQTLQNAIQLNRIGHAYLFSGPRGVGKTTMARILAKGLNCAEGATVTPCNVCPSCKEITAGQSMDVLEIDAASNTGVDNVRELRDSARYAPSRDRNKIFIIDEVHMLSTAAFNALLKILEEPPKHVVFIMATTERHKIPATILSRCQQFVFRSIASAEIQAHLREIAEHEGAKIDDRGLSYIVKAAEGSMRDAQSLLDQIISFGGQDVANEDVRDVLGFVPNDILDRTVDGIAECDSKKLIETVGIVVDQGLSLQQYARELIARTRDLLMMKTGLGDQVLGGADEKAELAKRAEVFSEQDLVRSFDLLLRLENDLRWTSQPRFHLEVGLVKLAKAGRMRDIEDVIRELKTGGSGNPAPASARPMSSASASTTSASTTSASTSVPTSPKTSPTASASTVSAPAETTPTATATPSNRAATVAKPSIPMIQIPQPPQQPQPQTRSTPGVASAAAATAPATQRATLNAVPRLSGPAPGPASEPASEPSIRESIKATIRETIKTTTGPNPGPIPQDPSSSSEASASVPATTAPPEAKVIAEPRAGKRAETGEALESAKNEPLVQRFLEVFRGDIAQVKPHKGETP